MARGGRVIANTSSGRRFGPLATYLAYGRSGIETERVAWTADRNLGTDDPELAAPLMQATARKSVLVQAPVYHLTISFDRDDPVSPAQMQAVADRVLHDLGLSEHQALMVAHRDQAHPHVHVMVNRVHPETGVAWERWQDRPKIERTLRAIERELGLREVAGRLYQPEAKEPPGRTRDPAFDQRVRAHLPELRAARSWDELEARLAAHGLRIEAKGQGIVITDGEHEVKASRVARDLSLRRLEERFGAPLPEREGEQRVVRRREPLTPAVNEVHSAVRDYERIAAAHHARTGIDADVSTLRSQLWQFERATKALAHAREQFGVALSGVYRDPESARAAIRAASAQVGPDRARQLLNAEPERFGALKTIDQPRAFGLVTVTDDSAARAAARGAALHWQRLTEQETGSAKLAGEYVLRMEARFNESLAQVYRDPQSARSAFELSLANAGAADAVRLLAESPDRLGALTPHATEENRNTLAARARDAIEARSVTSAALAHAHAERTIESRTERRGALDRTIGQAPSLDLLERAIGRAVDRLEPRELAQLRTTLTAPQAAIAFKAREAIRDMLLGREDRER